MKMELINSQNPPQTIKDYYQAVMARSAHRLLGVVHPEDQSATPRLFQIKPHGHHWRYASTHYGIMIPNLPEPLRYMSFAAVVGYVGFAITDVKAGLSSLGKGDTASLVHGTALSSTAEAYRTYAIRDDLTFKAAPFSVGFSQTSTLMQIGDDFMLRTQRHDLEVMLTLTPIPAAISWFALSPLYHHFSNLMTYQGTITQHGQSYDVQGLCTLEHWNAVATSMSGSRWLTDHLQLPVNVFSYQVINLNAEEQLLLAYITYGDQPVLTSVYYRNIRGVSIQFDGETTFEVTAVQAEPLITPDGDAMSVPDTFVWRAHHQGKQVLELYATVDTPYCFGLAAGYVTAYQWHGTFRSQACTGRGYMEFIDKRN